MKTLIFKTRLAHWISLFILNFVLCFGVYAQQAALIESDIFLDSDAAINAKDLYYLSKEWRNQNLEVLITDFNQDGIVNQKDLLHLIESYGMGDMPTPTPEIPDSTPTPEPTPTPPPVTQFVEFFTDFDDLTTLQETCLITYDATDAATMREQFVESGRMPDNPNQIMVPWFVFSATAENNPTGNLGVALSQPNSAAFNSDAGFYQFNQTSILELCEAFPTDLANLPMISFDIAFTFDQVGDTINDFMVVEVLREGATQWQPIDLNLDGNVVTDLNAVGASPDVFSPTEVGIFDGFYGTTNDADNRFDALGEEDFIHIEAMLPFDPQLRIAFRFQSDGSFQDEGAYIDNLRIFDANPQAGPPVITGVTPIYTEEVYIDADTPVMIEGRNLLPLGDIIYKPQVAAEEHLDYQITSEGIRVTLPKYNVPEGTMAILELVRTDGQRVNWFVPVESAPTPVITAISPNPFFLQSGDTTLTITGEHFRPVFDGGPAQQGSVVTFIQGSNDLVIDNPQDFSIRNETTIQFDAFQLTNLFDTGEVQVVVTNTFTGRNSQPFILNVEQGAGSINIINFYVDPGLPAFPYIPGEEIFPLQKDMAFMLLWEGDDLSENTINISINDENFVTSGNVASPNTVDLIVDPFSALLGLSPLQVPGEGNQVQAAIWENNTPPVVREFDIEDPLPPLIKEDSATPSDYSNLEFSASSEDEVSFTIFGDNFRGKNLFAVQVNPETPTRVSIYPVDLVAPTAEQLIELPVLNPFLGEIMIDPNVGDGFEDEIAQSFIPNTVFTTAIEEPTEFRVRVTNPDSSEFTDSEATFTVNP